jgi:hypothetical protein
MEPPHDFSLPNPDLSELLGLASARCEAQTQRGRVRDNERLSAPASRTAQGAVARARSALSTYLHESEQHHFSPEPSRPSQTHKPRADSRNDQHPKLFRRARMTFSRFQPR